MSDDTTKVLPAEEAAQKKEKLEKAWTMASSNYADYIEPHFAPLNKFILDEVVSRSPKKCLDVASGAGEPALSLAAALKDKCEVIGIDLSQAMVQLAGKRANERGITNCKFQVGDAENLSNFQDGEFDAVTCRQGFGFFPQPENALREFKRVLKNSGRFVLTIWGPEETAFLPKIAGGLIKRHFDVPDDPNAKAPWYWAGDGFLNKLLSKAGFSEITVKMVRADMSYSGVDELFEAMRGTPQRVFLEGASAEMVTKLKVSLKEIASDFAAGKGYVLPCKFMVGVCVKREDG